MNKKIIKKCIIVIGIIIGLLLGLHIFNKIRLMNEIDDIPDGQLTWIQYNQMLNDIRAIKLGKKIGFRTVKKNDKSSVILYDNYQEYEGNGYVIIYSIIPDAFVYNVKVGSKSVYGWSGSAWIYGYDYLSFLKRIILNF